MATFTIPKASTKTLKLTLLNSGTAVDLTEQSTIVVNLSNRSRAVSSYVFTVDGDPTDGLIKRVFQPGDTSSLMAGHYDAQAVVTFSDDTVRKFGTSVDDPRFNFIIQESVELEE